MTAISATDAFFIKLGAKGDWESECLQNGTIRFGYRETPHQLCLDGNWEEVRKVWNELRGDGGTASRDTNQIRTFYEANEQTIFITFSKTLLHWCRPSGPVELRPDGLRTRQTVDGWHSTSVGGNKLNKERLSGHLLKVQMFRGTICQVKDAKYLLRKINDELSPEIVAAEEAEHLLMNAIVALMRLLTWQDFELLVDLVFSSSGWRRLSEVGGTEKTTDFTLLLPTTGELATVQVKSHANPSSLQEFKRGIGDAGNYDKIFFVWHSGEVGDDTSPSDITLVGPERLSRLVLDAGLSSWLRDKVA